MAETRPYDNEDARRDLAAEMFKRSVCAAGLPADYDDDIEYLAPALVAFADEWAARDLAVTDER